MASVGLDDVVRCPSIPSLPAVAVQILELTSDPGVEMSEIGRVVQQDQGIATRVLKTINSPYYGLSTPCASIERAMALLGMNTVKSLVLGFSLIEVSSLKSDAFDLTALWRRGIYTAAAAERIAKLTRACDGDEAFTAALFQDIGMLAMFVVMNDEYADVIRGVDHRNLAEIEKSVFGFDHAEVGAQIGERWRLPRDLIESVRVHHTIDKASPAIQPLVRTVAMAREGAAVLTGASPQAATRRLYDAGREWFKMKTAPIDALLDDVNEAAATLAQQFGQDVGPKVDVRDVLERARDMQLEHQVSVEREREASAKAAETDALTGLANRARFDRELAGALAGGAVGLVYFDADKFKSVNDTLGHAAGDEVLKALAARSAGAVGDAGLVCRLGGEELAVIMPGAGMELAKRVGEQLRAQIEATPIDLRSVDCAEEERTVTVSVGVTAIDAAERETTPDAASLLAEADAAVYQAKRTGRNRVCVWPVEEASTDAPSAAAEQLVEPAPMQSSELVLIEDDPLSAALLATMFRREGATVRTLISTEQAEKWMAGVDAGTIAPPRLIMIDHHLNGETGIERLHALTGKPWTKGVRIVSLSAHMDEALRERYARIGVHRSISKFDLAKSLHQTVAELWNAPSLAA